MRVDPRQFHLITKWVIIRCNSKKDRQYHGQNKKDKYAPKSKVLILKDLYNTAQKSIRGIVIFVPFGNVPAKLNMLCHKLFNLTYYPGQVTYILNQWQI